MTKYTLNILQHEHRKIFNACLPSLKLMHERVNQSKHLTDHNESTLRLPLFLINQVLL